METDTPPSAHRVYDLIGEKMHALPPYFLARLEQKLKDYEEAAESRQRSIHLRLVPDLGEHAPLLGIDSHAELKRSSKVAVPIRTLEGLAAILEILHSVHVAKQEGDDGGLMGDHLVEGLIMSARTMVTSSVDAMWGQA